MLLKKKIEGKKSENLKAEKKINLAQIRWFPVPYLWLNMASIELDIFKYVMIS